MKLTAGFTKEQEIRNLEKLIDEFAGELKRKLIYIAKSNKRSGWSSESWRIHHIKQRIISQISKKNADPLDVAAFAAFWWNKL